MKEINMNEFCKVAERQILGLYINKTFFKGNSSYVICVLKFYLIFHYHN